MRHTREVARPPQKAPGTAAAGLTRRTLIAAGAGAAAAAAVPDVALAGKKKAAGAGVAKHLRRSSYEPLVGKMFEFRGFGAATIKLTLTEVSDLPTRPSPQPAKFRERAFVLMFKGPTDQPLAADVYGVHRRELGSFDVGIASATAGWASWDYSVVVNNARLKPKKRRKSKASKRDRRRSSRDRRRKRRKEAPEKARAERRSEPPKAEREPAPSPEPAPPAAPAPDPPVEATPAPSATEPATG